MLLAASGLLVLQAPSLRGSLPFAQHPSCLQPIMRATGDSVEVTIGGMHVRLFIRDGQLRVQAHRVGQAGNMVGAALTLPADAASGEAQEHEALPAPAATTTAPESEADVPAASPAAAEPVLDDGLRARLEGQLEPRGDWAPAARISRAWQAGLAARRQLQGLEVSPTPGLPLEKPHLRHPSRAQSRSPYLVQNLAAGVGAGGHSASGFVRVSRLSFSG